MLGVYVSQAKNPFVHKVSGHVVFEVNVLGSIVGYQVARHIQTTLVVHVDRDGCDDQHKLTHGVIDAQTAVACIMRINTASFHDNNIIMLAGQLGITVTIEINRTNSATQHIRGLDCPIRIIINTKSSIGTRSRTRYPSTLECELLVPNHMQMFQ